MKDNMQNIVDLIGALAEDIEEIKKKLEAKDTSDKDEAAKRLSVKLEPIIRFFGSSTPKNISEIFGSRESIDIIGQTKCALFTNEMCKKKDFFSRQTKSV